MVKKNYVLIIFFFLLWGCGNLFGQSPQTTPPLTEEEIKTFREISRYWNLTFLAIGVVASLLLPILGFIIGKTNFKSWFIPMVGENLMQKKEDLNGALERLLSDYQLRKNTRILVVSDKKGINLPMKNFLTEKGFSFSSTSDGFVDLTELNTLTLGGANLVLFNYIGQDLSVIQTTIGTKLLALKGQVKVVVAGNERMDPKYKNDMGNYLSFSNGYDTLESRIIGAIKQPVA